MSTQFTYHLPTKIIFGQPAHEALKRELSGLNANKVLLLSDPGLAQLGLVDRISAQLKQAGHAISLFTDVSSNPTTTEVAAGLSLARVQQTEVIIALGGGSAIDVAKAIAMLLANGGSYVNYQWEGKPITQRSRPLLAVPTTAGTGSEVSKVAVSCQPSVDV